MSATKLGASAPANDYTLRNNEDGSFDILRGTTVVQKIDSAGRFDYPEMPTAFDQTGGNSTGAGYSIMPNGLMIQWGVVSTSSTSQQAVTFIIPFTPTKPVITATVGQTPLTQVLFAIVSDIGISGFSIGSISHDGTRVSTNGVQWMAIGRWK
jgi:hypothetical protein